MKNRIILYHPKTSHERNYKFYWIPYSLLCVAAVLVDKKYDVQIIDGNLEEEIELAFEDVLCVGISSMIGHQIEDGLHFCQKIRKNIDAPIVWGGPFPTLLPEVLLSSDYVDYIIRGPGDYLFADFVESLKAGREPVEGVGYYKEGKKVLGTIQVLPDRNKTPKYPYHLLDLKKYIRNDPNISDKVINYVSSQGCPFGCGFCTDTAIYKQKWSAFTAIRTINEILDLTSKVSANGVKFYDSNFFANPKRAIEFAKILVDREANLKWAASAHPKNLLLLKDEDYIQIKKSGLTRLLIGAETGVQDELNFINKNLKLSETIYLAEKLEEHGIIGSFTFVTGYPTMPAVNIDKTVEFASNLAEKTKIHEYKIHLYLPFPGTPLYKFAVLNGFSSPKDMMGWSNLDYYEIETPWIDYKYQDTIRKFNTKYCPYVS